LGKCVDLSRKKEKMQCRAKEEAGKRIEKEAVMVLEGKA